MAAWHPIEASAPRRGATRRRPESAQKPRAGIGRCMFASRGGASPPRSSWVAAGPRKPTRVHRDLHRWRMTDTAADGPAAGAEPREHPGLRRHKTPCRPRRPRRRVRRGRGSSRARAFLLGGPSDVGRRDRVSTFDARRRVHRDPRDAIGSGAGDRAHRHARPRRRSRCARPTTTSAGRSRVHARHVAVDDAREFRSCRSRCAHGRLDGEADHRPWELPARERFARTTLCSTTSVRAPSRRVRRPGGHWRRTIRPICTTVQPQRWQTAAHVRACRDRSRGSSRVVARVRAPVVKVAGVHVHPRLARICAGNRDAGGPV